MTPEEALEYKRKGGKLYEPITPRDVALMNSEAYFKSRGTVIIQTYIPATNPRPEDGK